MKLINSILVSAITAAVLSACSGSNTSEESATPATDLSQAIDKSLDDGDFATAQTLIDSLRRTYPDSVELRKLTLMQSARAAEGMALKAIPQVEAEMARWQLTIDSLSSFFTTVSTPGAGSYSVDKAINSAGFLNNNAVQPRLGDAEMPWMLAVNICGKHINPTVLKLIDADGSVLATAVNGNAPANSVSDASSQMLIWGPESSLPIAQALATRGNAKALKIQASGAGGKVVIPLSEATARAIVRTQQLAAANDSMRNTLIERERLERKLVITRNQQANAPR